MSDKEIVMYVRSSYCPTVALARDLLTRYGVEYRELNYDDDPRYVERLKTWNGHLGVPTIIIAESGQEEPNDEILPKLTGRTNKGYDRGPLITEPNNRQLEDWLHKHGFLDKPYRR